MTLAEALHDRTDLKANVCTVLCIMGAFGTCITKPDSSTWCFVGQKSNLHKSILNDFEKVADNFFTIQHLLNYRFLQRN